MKKRYIKWAYVLIWALLIFIFSQQTGESSNENNKFVAQLLNLIGIDIEKLLGSISDFVIRKIAHFTEYFILYVFLYRAMIEDMSITKSLAFSIIGVFLYACTDEIHQAFVPERGPSFRDVMIDTGGGTLAMIITYMCHLQKKFCQKEKRLD